MIKEQIIEIIELADTLVEIANYLNIDPNSTVADFKVAIINYSKNAASIEETMAEEPVTSDTIPEETSTVTSESKNFKLNSDTITKSFAIRNGNNIRIWASNGNSLVYTSTPITEKKAIEIFKSIEDGILIETLKQLGFEWDIKPF